MPLQDISVSFCARYANQNLSFRVVPVKRICDKGCYSGPVPPLLANGHADRGDEVLGETLS